MISIIRMQLSERPFHLTMSLLENKVVCVRIVLFLYKITTLSILRRSKYISFFDTHPTLHMRANRAVLG